MSWPTPQDYNEAIQTPRSSFADAELRAGRPELNGMGLPLPRTGAFASVYRMHCAKTDWAVRFFLQNVTDQQSRYREISKFVMSDELPYTVSFDYEPDGVRIRNNWYPILKMQWVNGESLDHYIAANHKKRDKLIALVDRFEEMVTALRAVGIAHGDLQHGNVILVNDELRLVDYDGMFVPGLAGKASNELGHRNYQHPGRRADDFGTYLDHFSAWVIGLSLRCLIEDPSLLRLPGAGDECILFRQSDFLQGPGSSLVQALSKHSAARIRQSVEILMALLCYPVQEVPPFSSSLERVDQLPEPSRLLTRNFANLNNNPTQQAASTTADTKNWWADFVVASDPANSATRSNDGHWLSSWNPEFRSVTAQQQHLRQAIPSQPQTPGQVYYLQGVAQYQAGNYRQALRYIEHALAENKTDTHVMCMLGRTYEKLNNFDAALVNYDRALREHSTPEAMLCKAGCLSELGRLKEADRLLAECLRADPKSAEIGLARAKNRFKMKDYTVVLSIMDVALSYEPQHAECYFWRGMALENLKRFEEARESFQTACDNGRGSSEVFLHIGIASEELAELAAAVDAYEHAVQLQPTFAEAQFRLGNCYYRLSKFELAHAAFSSGLKVEPNANAWLHDGFSLYEIQSYKVAVKAFQNAESLDKQLFIDLPPRNVLKVRASAAYTMFEAGKFVETLQELDAAELVAGELPGPLKRKRAQAYAAMQDWHSAIDAYTTLVSTEKREPSFYLDRGDCWLQLKNAPHALADYLRASRFDITNPEVQMRLGSVYLQCGKPSDALAHFLMVLNKQPNSVEALTGLARARYMAGQLNPAFDALETALHIEPLNLRALATMAQVLVRMEKFELAIKHANLALNILKRDPEALHARAAASLKLGHYVAALADYDSLRTFQADGVVDRSRGLCLHNLGRHKEAITALLQVTANHNDDSEAFFALALSYFRTNDFDKSLEYAQRALALQSEAPGILLLIADCHKALSNSDLALAEYTKVLELRWPPLEAYVHRAMCYVRLGQPDKAMSDLKQYFRLGGKEPVAHVLLAKLRLAGQSVEALDGQTQSEIIKDLNACLQLEPANVEALSVRAQVYAVCGPLALALEDCNEWVKLQPNNAQAYLTRGAVMYWLTEYNGSKANFAEARRINPLLENDARFAPYYDLCATQFEVEKNWPAMVESLQRGIRLNSGDMQRRYRLAGAYLAEEHYDESEDQLEFILKGVTGVNYRSVVPFFAPCISASCASAKLADMEVAAYLSRSSICFAEKRYGEALNDAKKAVSLDDSNPIGWLLIAMVHQATKRHRMALIACTKVLALDVNSARALEIAASSCYQLNEPNTAASCAEQLVRLKPRSIAARQLAGYCLVKAKRFYDAQVHFREALQGHRTTDWDHISFAGHGLAWLGLKKRREAEQAFKEALAVNQNSAVAHFGLAQILFEKRKYKECVESLNTAVRCDPEYLDAYELRAAAYNKLRRFEDAAHDFRKVQDMQESAESTEEGSIDASEKPAVDAEKPALDAEKPAPDAEKSAVDAAQKGSAVRN